MLPKYEKIVTDLHTIHRWVDPETNEIIEMEFEVDGRFYSEQEYAALPREQRVPEIGGHSRGRRGKLRRATRAGAAALGGGLAGASVVLAAQHWKV